METVQKNLNEKFIQLYLYKKPSLRTNYIESDNEEDIDMENHVKIKNLPSPQKNSDAVDIFYVDSGLTDPYIIRNRVRVDFNDKNLDNVRFVTINRLPGFPEDLTPKIYSDQVISHSVDESSLFGLDTDEKKN